MIGWASAAVKGIPSGLVYRADDKMLYIADSGNGRIAKLVNNYARISFSFAPPLLAWLEERAPEVYAAILEADRASRAT